MKFKERLSQCTKFALPFLTLVITLNYAALEEDLPEEAETGEVAPILKTPVGTAETINKATAPATSQRPEVRTKPEAEIPSALPVKIETVAESTPTVLDVEEAQEETEAAAEEIVENKFINDKAEKEVEKASPTVPSSLKSEATLPEAKETKKATLATEEKEIEKKPIVPVVGKKELEKAAQVPPAKIAPEKNGTIFSDTIEIKKTPMVQKEETKAKNTKDMPETE